MRHLETKREAAERRRVSLMSKGIAQFLETTSHVTEANLQTKVFEKSPTRNSEQKAVSVESSPTISTKNVNHEPAGENAAEDDRRSPHSNVLDQIKLTLDRAAELDRKSTRLNSSHRSLSRMPSSA